LFAAKLQFHSYAFFKADLCLLELEHQERWLLWCFSPAVTPYIQDDWLLLLQSFALRSFKIPKFQ